MRALRDILLKQSATFTSAMSHSGRQRVLRLLAGSRRPQVSVNEAFERIVLTKNVELFSKNSQFRRAAELYSGIDMFEKAADNYRLASCYNDGAAALARGNHFDSLVRYLSRYAF